MRKVPTQNDGDRLSIVHLYIIITAMLIALTTLITLLASSIYFVVAKSKTV